MQAAHREVRRYAADGLDESLVRRAARDCEFKQTSGEPKDLSFTVRFSAWSFGERIDVHLSQVDGRTMLDVESRCRWPFQIEDYGKNQQNVRRLLSAIDTALGEDVESEPMPICASCDYLLAGLKGEVCPECGANIELALPVSRWRMRARLRLGMKWAALLSAIEVPIFLLLIWRSSWGASHPLFFWLAVLGPVLVNFTFIQLLLVFGHFMRWARSKE